MTRSGTTLVRVRYAETDQMQVVYHANYFIWFEVGRTDLLRQLGWSYRELEAAGFWLPVLGASCAYHCPARYDDEIEIRTTGRLASAVRMAFDYQAVRRADGQAVRRADGQAVRRADGVVTASGQTVHAAVAPDGRPCRLPERVRDLFR